MQFFSEILYTEAGINVKYLNYKKGGMHNILYLRTDYLKILNT